MGCITLLDICLSPNVVRSGVGKVNPVGRIGPKGVIVVLYFGRSSPDLTDCLRNPIPPGLQRSDSKRVFPMLTPALFSIFSR